MDGMYWAPLALCFALIVFVRVAVPALAGGAARRVERAKSAAADDRSAKRIAAAELDGRLNLDVTQDQDFAYAAQAAARRAAGPAKRLVDIVAAIALLVFFAPLLLIVALLIKLETPGPVLYRQQRVGLGGREFAILKFRSMVADAERDGVRWASKNDQRVTRVGRVIRKLRIDEIPQAVNILRGEMSFVGPRPERPEFVRLLESEVPSYHLRHKVRPGLTGWAQVKYVYGASIEDARVKLQYDLYYLKHYSLWRDLAIIAMTVRVALLGLGSR